MQSLEDTFNMNSYGLDKSIPPPIKRGRGEWKSRDSRSGQVCDPATLLEYALVKLLMF